MKKITALLAALILISGCSDADNIRLSLPDTYSDYYEYENNDVLGCFNADENGNIYLYSYKLSQIGLADAYCFSEYSMDGIRKDICFTDNAPLAFDVADDTVYGAYTVSLYDSVLKAFDINTQETKEVCALEGLCQVKHVEICGDYAFIFGIDCGRMGIDGEYRSDFSNYCYNGEKIVKVRLSTGEIKESDVPYPIEMSCYADNCIIYAADKDGYYFTDFDNIQRKPHKIELLQGFCAYEQNRFIFSSMSGINIGMLCSGSTDADDGMSQLENRHYPNGEMFTVGGYTFFKTMATDTEKAKIIRIKNKKYIKSNNKIRMISCNNSFDAPFGCGYTIDYNNLSADSFSLSILSNDRNYDISIVNSYDSCSSGIRDKGVFYPLNDLPEVVKYLDICFPYIKEAATDRNGDIWMLPVSLGIPVIAYNSETCGEAGIEFGGEFTIEEFVKICETAYNSAYKNGYDIQPYVLTQNLLIGYMADNNTFNTTAFRAFAEFAKDRINISDTSAYPPYFSLSNNAMSHLYEADGEKQFLFTYQRSSGSAVWFSEYDNFRYAKAPSIAADANPIATCAFITVNPSSDNLEAALNYVSALAEYLGNEKNTFMISDKSAYSSNDGSDSLYEIYKKADIGFNLSEEICFEPYLRYLAGKITIDDMIEEADRKLSAYLNE